MRIHTGSSRRAFFNAFVMSLFAVLSHALPVTAAGFDQPAYGGRRDAAKVPASSSQHQSFIRIDDTDASVHRNITIGLGKSVLIEFPRPVRDVMVSNPTAVDAVVLSSNRVFLLARKLGDSNAFFFDASGEQFATMEIQVERETAGLENLLNRLIIGANIKVEMLNQTIALTGTVKSPADSVRASQIAKQFAAVDYDVKETGTTEGVGIAKAGQSDASPVVNMLSVDGEEQVMLKVTVAEVKRTLLKQMGINIGGIISSGSFTTKVLTDNALPLTTALGLNALPVFAGATALSSSTTGNSGVSTNWTSGGNQVSSAIRALERDGLVRTLAEPNLTAISGEPAEFLAGGEVPYVTGVDTTTGTKSVAFKKFGVQLSFTPVVLTEGRISLKIDTGVSSISEFISGNPVFDSRQAKTVVELPSGGSLALAGLISTKNAQNIDGLPGAKDLPILGTLFRSRDFQNEESELVVIVTPYLVQPTSRQQLALPTDGLQPATDLKGDFLGHLNRIYGQGRSAPSGGLKGDYGFIVE